jgi:GNAT superfamily N-acetyltransferase
MEDYTLASGDDYDELIDFANYVFRQDFPSLLPKLYTREWFNTDGMRHYIVRDKGRIKAVVGGYPLKLRAGSSVLEGRGVGMVSVHPYARGKGYMKALMAMALDDMRKDGVVFSGLAGQKQRYGYYGYSRIGWRSLFIVDKANIRHSLSRETQTKNITLEKTDKTQTERIALFQKLHNAKRAAFIRPEDSARFYAVLNSWRSTVYSILVDCVVSGYLLYGGDGESFVHEINLADEALYAELPAIMGKFLEQEGLENVRVLVQPFERNKLTAFDCFAELGLQEESFMWQIFDFVPFIRAFMELQAETKTLPDGSFTLAVDDKIIRLSAADNKPACEIVDEKPALKLDAKDAAEFLFSPFSPFTRPEIAASPFLQSLLPLPLFMETADEV